LPTDDEPGTELVGPDTLVVTVPVRDLPATVPVNEGLPDRGTLT
jgi:hypothetical protein